jgi:hypothetical protein
MSRKRKVYASDHERIDGIIDNLPHHQTNVLALDEIKTLKDLKRACRQRGIETTGFLERGDYIGAIYMFDKNEVGECSICMNSFKSQDTNLLLLCSHEFHLECFRRAAHSEFDRTEQMPTCVLCRVPIRSSKYQCSSSSVSSL